MRRPWVRALMVLVGLSLLALYALASLAVLLALQWFLSVQAGGWPALGALVVAVLVTGYLSYRVGTARLLAGIDTVVLDRRRAPGVHRRLDRLVDRMDVRRPELRVGDIGGPNALSIGTRNGGTIVLDRQVLSVLSLAELEGILAHELAHAESHDGLLKTLTVATMQTVVTVLYVLVLPVTLLLTGLARAIAWARGRPTHWQRTAAGTARRLLEVLVLVAMSVLTLAVLAHSRRREFAADRRAAEVTGNPLALARALRKIERANSSVWDLLSPLSITGEDEERLRRLFSTHPPTEERIERLLQVADSERLRVGR